MGQIYLPGRRKHFAGSWSNWDGVTEAALASPTCFVCCMENTIDGGSETGQGGGLTGADLVLSDNGTIAGMVNNRRNLDGSNDYFSMTQTAVETLLVSQPIWAILAKFRVWTTMDTAGGLFEFADTAYANQILCVIDGAGGQVNFELIDSDSAVEAKSFSGTHNDGDFLYTFVGCDGSETRCGVNMGDGSGAHGQPTKWSDFGETYRAIFTRVFDNFDGFALRRGIGYEGNWGNDYWQGRMFNITIWSGECPIDFTA